jgi:hypothetical protein
MNFNLNLNILNILMIAINNLFAIIYMLIAYKLKITLDNIIQFIDSTVEEKNLKINDNSTNNFENKQKDSEIKIEKSNDQLLIIGKFIKFSYQLSKKIFF